MVTWNRVSPADVLRAIKDYDRLGPERFFSEHGFAPTTISRGRRADQGFVQPWLQVGPARRHMTS